MGFRFQKHIRIFSGFTLILRDTLIYSPAQHSRRRAS